MIRKEVDAILEEDFEIFLRDSDLFEQYQNNQLLCSCCSEHITKENIFAIYYDDGFKFCCIKLECMEIFNERKSN